MIQASRVFLQRVPTLSIRLQLASWKRCQQTQVAFFRGPRFRSYNEDRDIPLESSDDEDRQQRKYVFVSDDDERLFEEENEEEKLDDDSFYFPAKEDLINKTIWDTVERYNKAEIDNPEEVFAEWKAQAVASETVDTHKHIWVETALTITRRILSSAPLDNLSLHAFNVDLSRRRLHITLDKFADPYGSPSIEEITLFTEILSTQLEEALGTAVSESVQYEVSSPGAERLVRHAFELQRFQHLPMNVVYRDDNDKTVARVFQFLRHNDSKDVTVWKLWNGRRNRNVAKVNKADFKREWQIATQNIVSVHLFLDI